MKQLFFSFAVMAATIFTSCSKSDVVVDNSHDTTHGTVIAINLQNSEQTTRSFLDDAYTVEAWEKEINYVTLFLFDTNQGLMKRKTFQQSDINNGRVTVELPYVLGNRQCAIFAIANTEIAEDVQTITQLSQEIQGSAAPYNGTFAEVSTASKRGDGFVMSGVSMVTLAESGADNVHTIDMTRTVAKLAIETTIDPTFTSSLHGELVLKNVSVGGSFGKTTLFKDYNMLFGDTRDDFYQVPGYDNQSYNNLYYLNSTDHDMINIAFNLIYDEDGDLSDDSDQTEYHFVKRMPNEIVRNTYYRVACNISGTSPEAATVSLNVIGWEMGGSNEFDENIDIY